MVVKIKIILTNNEVLEFPLVTNAIDQDSIITSLDESLQRGSLIYSMDNKINVVPISSIVYLTIITPTDNNQPDELNMFDDEEENE